MTVTVQGYGTFTIPNDRVQELIQWLQQNSVKLEEKNQQSGYDGVTLLNG